MTQAKDIFSSIKIGPLNLPNRIVMAPMTRCRAGEGNVATPLMAKYYSQRASAGLIVSEGSQVSTKGAGYPSTPGIYSAEQVEGWKLVTDAVHKEGGHIFLQLWHVGRISHPDYQGGEAPVAPSAIAPAGEAATYEGMKAFVTPRALGTDEVASIVKQFQDGAKNALEAGFDGVEIHSANGYLLDQFLRDSTNKRDDNYGGSVENRARLLVEIIEAVGTVYENNRVGVRLSPSGAFNDISDSDPEKLFGYVAEQMNRFDLAYLHIVDALESDIRHGAKVVALPYLRKFYKGKIIICGGYDKQKGNRVIAEGNADAVAFGQLFISNPDLPERLKADAPLNETDPPTFYGGGEKGYVDYPFM
ncbi:NADH:flavin oxidoreductases, Old Yellow Enzyme family [hydrothermal vent metagenome]|uniref:NADH:flavin oxidoreductases, Old Yellow Enzyme family n=1 Tax=hydrothermal vent metagenome TaxID=652676 RepID=A0A3B1CQX1_9ZZZZ